MNYLKNKLVYLSGAIEADNSLINWRIPVIERLEKFGLKVFDPNSDPKQNRASELYKAKQNKDFDKVAEIAKGFCRKDLNLVDKSDIVVVRARHDIPSVGTWHECFTAWDNKKIVLLVNEEGIDKISSWLFAFIPVKYMFGSWQDLYDYLDLVDKGYMSHDFRFATLYNLI